MRITLLFFISRGLLLVCFTSVRVCVRVCECVSTSGRSGVALWCLNEVFDVECSAQLCPHTLDRGFD